MHRALSALAAAAILAATAAAHLPPPPQLDPDCAPLKGVWAQAKANIGAEGGSDQTVIAIGTWADATVLTYKHFPSRTVEPQVVWMRVSCETKPGGALLVMFIAPPGDPRGFSMRVTIDDRSFRAAAPDGGAAGAVFIYNKIMD